jgi:hypothetical protein
MVVLFKTGGVGGQEIWHHHYRLCTTPTPSLHSLGLMLSAGLIILRIL